MALTEPFISLYCERQSTGFWAEPFNAVSNLAFAAAAVAAFSLWLNGNQQKGDRAVAALIAIVMMIAVGSFFFHTLPGPVTVLLDVVPIQLFVLGYFALALRRFLVWPLWGVALGLGALLVISAGLPLAFPPAFLSGSVAYIPALAALTIIAAALLLKSRRHFRAGLSDPRNDLAVPRSNGRTALVLLSGAALFAVSLAARTLDKPLCGAWPLGLHFIWHLLNGALLFLLLFAAMSHKKQRR